MKQNWGKIKMSHWVLAFPQLPNDWFRRSWTFCDCLKMKECKTLWNYGILDLERAKSWIMNMGELFNSQFNAYENTREWSVFWSLAISKKHIPLQLPISKLNQLPFMHVLETSFLHVGFLLSLLKTSLFFKVTWNVFSDHQRQWWFISSQDLHSCFYPSYGTFNCSYSWECFTSLIWP